MWSSPANGRPVFWSGKDISLDALFFPKECARFLLFLSYMSKPVGFAECSQRKWTGRNRLSWLGRNLKAKRFKVGFCGVGVPVYTRGSSVALSRFPALIVRWSALYWCRTSLKSIFCDWEYGWIFFGVVQLVIGRRKSRIGDYQKYKWIIQPPHQWPFAPIQLKYNVRTGGRRISSAIVSNVAASFVGWTVGVIWTSFFYAVYS